MCRLETLDVLLLRGTVFAYRGDSVVKEDNVMLEDKEDNNKLLMFNKTTMRTVTVMENRVVVLMPRRKKV